MRSGVAGSGPHIFCSKYFAVENQVFAVEDLAPCVFRSWEIRLAIRILFAYTAAHDLAGSSSTQAAEKKYFLLSFPKKLPRIHKRFADIIALASRVPSP